MLPSLQYDGAFDYFKLDSSGSIASAHASKVFFIQILPRYVIPLADIPPMMITETKDVWEKSREMAQEILREAHAAAMKMELESEGIIGSDEDEAQCIAKAAQRHRCSVIVVGTAGHNALLRLLSGSVIPGLITHSPVPVLVCQADTTQASKEQRTAAIKRPRRHRGGSVLSRV